MLRIFRPDDRVGSEEARTLCLALRQSRELTQGQLARLLGVSRRTVENLEQRRTATVAASLLERLRKLQ